LAPTAAEDGTEYACQVCGRTYRSGLPASRLALECRGTPEQWAARRLAIAAEAVAQAVTEHRRAVALEQLERCLVCREFLGAACRLVGGCSESWIRAVKRGGCAAR
jgi:hypothetical protein